MMNLTEAFKRQHHIVAFNFFNAETLSGILEAAKEEVDHLAHFQVGIREHREGRKVVAVTLSFWRKDDAAIDAAADELERAKVGRRARRTGTVEAVAVQTHLQGADTEGGRR